MEPENNFSRLERTLWTVWNFISEAVTRLIRPQPIAVGSELNPCEEPAVTEEPPDSEDEEDNSTKLQQIIKEENPATFSLLDAIDPPFPQENSITEVHPESDKDGVKHNDPPCRSSESNKSDHPEATSEEKFHQTTHDAAVLITQDAIEDEENKVTELQTCVQDEMPESDEHQHTSSEVLTDDAIQGKNETSEQKTDAEDTVSALTGDHCEDNNETTKKMQVNEDPMYAKGEELTEFSPEEDDIDEGEPEEQWDCAGIVELAVTTRQVEKMLTGDDNFSCEVIVEGEEAVITCLSQTDEEEEDMSFLDGSKQGTIIGEENGSMDTNSQTKVEVPNQENLQIPTEDSQEDSEVSEYVSCIDEPVKSEIRGKKEEGVALTKPQTNTRETGVKTRDHFGDEEDVTFCTDASNENTLVEILQTISSVAVYTDGETGQETSGEQKSIPPGIGGGQFVVSEELTTQACEETQEGVPGNNNEFGLDENTTQRLVEVGVYEEFKAAQLPEEVESKRQENLKNTEADRLLMHEYTKEKTENSEDNENIVELDVVEHSGVLPRPEVGLPQETTEQLFGDPGFLLGEEGELCGSLMETEIKSLREVVRFDLNYKTVKTTEELQTGTKKQFIEFREDEELSKAEEPEAIGDDHDLKLAAEEAMEIVDETLNQGFCRGQNSNRIQSFEQEIHLISLEHSAEDGAGFLEYSPVEKPDTGMTLEGEDQGEKHLRADKDQIKGEMGLLAGAAAGLSTERKVEEDLLISDSELSGYFETQKRNDQPPHRAFEIWEKEVTKDTETVDGWKTTESTPKDLSVMSSEKRTKHVTGFSIDTTSREGQKVIEEIHDSRIETPMSLIKQLNSEDVVSFDPSEETTATVTGSYIDSEIPTVSPLYLGISQVQTEERTVQSVDSVTGLQRDLNEEWIDTQGADPEEGDIPLCAEMRAEFENEKTKSQDHHLEVNMSESSDEIKKTKSGRSSVCSEVSSGDVWTHGETWPDSGYEALNLSSQSEDVAESVPKNYEGEAESDKTSEDEVDVSALDFSPQRSRISIKNPRVRPPTNPRVLINMPSLEPTSSSPVQARVPAGLSLGGLGIGIKLPGLGAGFPILKKTPPSRDESLTQKDPEPLPEEKSEAAMKEEPRKPKWMSPMHQGFGNPLMSELKTKLKKTSDE